MQTYPSSYAEYRCKNKNARSFFVSLSLFSAFARSSSFAWSLYDVAWFSCVGATYYFLLSFLMQYFFIPLCALFRSFSSFIYIYVDWVLLTVFQYFISLSRVRNANCWQMVFYCSIHIKIVCTFYTEQKLLCTNFAKPTSSNEKS